MQGLIRLGHDRPQNRDVLSPHFERDNPGYDPRLDWCGPAAIGQRLGRDLVCDSLFGVSLRRACYLHDDAWAHAEYRAGNLEFRRNIRALYRAAAWGKLGRRPGLRRVLGAAWLLLAGEAVAWCYYRGVAGVIGRLIFLLVVWAERRRVRYND